ncbi:MAG: sigma-70 family RNA polymerase sigma factor [Prevotellaceae bacterium]|nr:sigma-70 family RNA polymerase sigma factor [Prevotellaceae bacterium]
MKSSKTLTNYYQENHEVFSQIYVRFHKPLYDFLRVLTRSSEAAKDITHNVFINVWENMEKLDHDKGVQRYLFVVAKHLAMRYFRQKKIEKNYFDHGWLPSIEKITPDEWLYAKEAALLVEAAISKMPRIRRQIFEMFYRDGLSYDQIANNLNMRKTTVANHLTHAKNDVRKMVQIENVENVFVKNKGKWNIH